MAKIFLLFFFAFTTRTTWACSGTAVEKSSGPHEGEKGAPLNVLCENSGTREENPHHVSLQATNMQNKHFCSASIISPVFLVSAAHCFEPDRLPYIQAVAGVRNLKVLDGTAQIRNVTQVYVHGKYDAATRDNDIALLVLNQPLDFDDEYVRPIALWESNWKLPQFAKVSGWGYRSHSKLASVQVPIIDRENCTATWGERDITVTNNMICARTYPDACPGDSGGPLTCAKDGTKGQPQQQRYLCGIISWGQDCAVQPTLQYPGVYTDVTKYTVWIRRHLSGWVLHVTKEHTLPAHVPETDVAVPLGEHRNFSCEAPGRQEVSFCFWQWENRESKGLIFMYQKGETAEQDESLGDTTYLGTNGLKDGICEMSTSYIPTRNPSGRWTCLLVTGNRTIFTGAVTVNSYAFILLGEIASHGSRGPESGDGQAKFPHIVSLRLTSGQRRPFCAASIIHSRILVSAAHCFKDYKPPYNIQAVAGEYDLDAADGTEQVRHVTRLIIHEQYNTTRNKWDHDIALLVLNESLKFDEQYVRPIILPDSKVELPDSARVSGWGDGSRSGKLEYATVKIRDRENCTAAWATRGYTITDNMICAGGKRDACKGDSGGPLTCINSRMDKKFLCGIVSWGQRCAGQRNSQYPGLYTDVRNFNYWIKRQMGILALTLPEIQLPAYVPQRTIRAKLHASQNFSCKTPAHKTLNLCLWLRDESVVLDQQDGHEGKIIIPGILHEDNLWPGECGLKISSLSVADFKSRWTCVLVTWDNTIYTGRVAINRERTSYFATQTGGIQAHSTLTLGVRTILNSSENCYGITYDTDENKIYWSTWTEHKIYRANAADGTEVETVLNTTKYGKFQGMAFDWISANIYIGTSDGYIIVCSKNPVPTLTCVPVINKNSSSPSDFKQIALNPIQGTMYWTAYTEVGSSGIRRAGMDGSNVSTIVTGLQSPHGIVLDLQMSRLYWADYIANKIQSSSLDGADVRTIIEFPGATPLGIAVVGNKIFWGSRENQELQSSTTDGADIRILHRDDKPIMDLVVGLDLDLPKNHTNNCEGQSCPTICVLNPTSFKCF